MYHPIACGGVGDFGGQEIRCRISVFGASRGTRKSCAHYARTQFMQIHARAMMNGVDHQLARAQH